MTIAEEVEAADNSNELAIAPEQTEVTRIDENQKGSAIGKREKLPRR